MDNNRDFSLHDYLHTITKRLPIITEATVLIVFFVMLFSYYQTPVFETKGRVMVQKDDFTVSESSTVYKYNESITNYIELVKSSIIKQQVVSRLNRFFVKSIELKDSSEFEELFQRELPKNYDYIHSINNGDTAKREMFFKDEFRKIKNQVTPDSLKTLSFYELDVFPVISTEILEVVVRFHNPVINSYISHMLFEIFADSIQKTKSEEYDKKIVFLKEQMTETLDMIKKYENNLKTINQEGNAYNVSDEMQKLEDELRKLKSERDQAKRELDSAKASKEKLNKKLKDSDFSKDFTLNNSEAYGNYYIDDMRIKLTDLQLQLTSSKLIYGDSHPKVVELQTRLDLLKTKLEKEYYSKKKENPEDNPFYRQLLGKLVDNTVDITLKEAEVKSYNTLIKEKENQYKKLPEILQDYNLVQRDLQLAEKTYNTFLENLNDIKIKKASVKTKIKILDRAPIPGRPLKPNMKFNFILAMLAGILTGITLAFLIEHLDRSIKSPEEAENLFKLPLLARIPGIRKSEVSDIEPSLDPMLLTYFEPKNIASEQFKMLMINTKFGFSGITARNSVIMVNSAEPSEGKSLVLSNLAITYSLAGYKTVIVDADFHKPSQHKFFNTDNFKGLTDIMLDNTQEDLIKATPVDNLYLITSGATPPSPAMFFESEQFETLISDLREKFDIVLIDTAPASNISDSLLIVQKVDNILFVISLRQSSRKIINKSLNDIKNIFQGPLGIVCNKVTLKNISGYYYNY